jgi:PhoH-like ATPase
MKKVFVLDTNIILNDAKVIEILSEEGKNIIIIPATVQDEIDAKKSGDEKEINFQAREFNRMFEESEIISTEELGDIANRIIVKYKQVELHLIELKHYNCLQEFIDPKIINDRKIIETAEKVKHFYKKYDEYHIISNDIAFRTRSIFKKLKTKPFRIHDLKEAGKLEFIKELEIQDDSVIKETMLISDLTKEIIPNNISCFIISNGNTGNKFYGIRENNMITLLWEHTKEKKLSGQYAYPKNVEQKFMYALMLSDYYDIIVSDSSAGTGKTILTLSAACHLLDTRKDKYNKIIFSRKTVISGDKLDEVGFLKGGLDEKTAGFLGPLEDTIENFVLNKNKSEVKTKSAKKLSKEELEVEIEDFKKRYNIEFAYQGHLRGRTLSNSIIILDEIQSNSIKEIQTILTRVGENCKIFIIGSVRQIDNPYLNKFNNSLTFLLNKTQDDNEAVKIAGVRLVKTERSRIAEWADKFNQPKEQ